MKYLEVVLLFVLVSCGFLHDPFRNENVPVPTSTTTTTPVYSVEFACELTKSRKITFRDIPKNLNDIYINYKSQSPTYIKINGAGFLLGNNNDFEDYSFNCSDSNRRISIEIDSINKFNIIYIKKVRWDKSESIEAGEIMAADLPLSCFENGAILKEIR